MYIYIYICTCVYFGAEGPGALRQMALFPRRIHLYQTSFSKHVFHIAASWPNRPKCANTVDILKHDIGVTNFESLTNHVYETIT